MDRVERGPDRPSWPGACVVDRQRTLYALNAATGAEVQRFGNRASSSSFPSPSAADGLGGTVLHPDPCLRGSGPATPASASAAPDGEHLIPSKGAAVSGSTLLMPLLELLQRRVPAVRRHLRFRRPGVCRPH